MYDALNILEIKHKNKTDVWVIGSYQNLYEQLINPCTLLRENLITFVLSI